MGKEVSENIKHKIPSDELKFYQIMPIDEIGAVFEWKGKLFRGIYPSGIETVQSYFSTGFMEEAIKMGYVPNTWISEYTSDTFPLILEHERITPALTDSEWTFDMLKDAAIMILSLAGLALKHGFNMKDNHTLNVMFKNNKPVFVDIGSFVLNKPGVKVLMSIDSFHTCYTYLLKIWSMGLIKVGKRMVSKSVLPKEEYYIIKNPVWRWFSGILRLKLRISHNLLTLAKIPDTSFNGRRNNKILLGLKKLLVSSRMVDGINLGCTEREIRRIKTPRELIKKIESQPITIPQEVEDILKGEQKLMVVNPSNPCLMEQLSSKRNITEILAVDMDEAKGNSNYNMFKRMPHLKCTNAVYDFGHPVVYVDVHKAPNERFKYNTIIAYLSNEIKTDLHRPIRLFFKVISQYGCKNLILIDKKDSGCYSEDDFRGYFSEVKKIDNESFEYNILERIVR